MNDLPDNDSEDIEDLDDYEKWALDNIEEAIAIFVAKHGEEKIPDDEVLIETALKRLHKTISEEGTVVFDMWQAYIPKATRLKRHHDKKFNAHLQEVWGKSLLQLKLFIDCIVEVGNGFIESHRPNDITARKGYLFEVMCRLHQRSCLIGLECLALLNSGYADGALARWRALYELATVGDFISKHGNETAERYLLHEHIKRYKLLTQYQLNYEEMNVQFESADYESMPPEDLAQAEKTYNDLIRRFDKEYGSDYGWAHNVLGGKSANFATIEENVGRSFLRPFYKAANRSVHPHESFYLGEPIDEEITVYGPSVFGLEIVIQWVAITLAEVTEQLFLTRRSFEGEIKSDGIHKWVKLICTMAVEEALALDKMHSEDQPE